MTALAELGSFPAAHPLLPGYDRHGAGADDVAAAVTALVGDADWAGRGWPDLLAGLAALGRTDIPLARLSEGHIDAVRILAEAGRAPVRGAVYGVWASRSHRTGLRAAPASPGWTLSGTLRFASGAGIVDRALVPVWPSEHVHVLLDLDVADWVADGSGWHTRAMAVSRTYTYEVAGAAVAAAAQVGDPGFYLGRRGFFPGGIGVAAVWSGGAARLLDLVTDAGRSAPPSVSRAAHLGFARAELAGAQALIWAAGQELSSGTATDLRPLATLTRLGVAGAVRRILGHVRDVAGPAGLAYATDLTRAIDDLELYVRQLNPDADAEYLGASR